MLLEAPTPRRDGQGGREKGVKTID